MEFRIEVTALEPPAGWTVKVFDVEAGAYLRHSVSNAELPSRNLQRRSLQRRNLTFVLPLPPEADVNAMAGTEPHRDLCVDPEKTLDAFEAIVQKSNPDTMRFGRYLFDTLIGAEVWTRLLERTAGQALELSLAWRTDDPVLNRLPWEMMHTPGRWFVAQEGRVAIVRRCLGASQGIGTLSTPPKVLFVVGTDLQNDVIQPGAEYLRLLQGLRAADLEVNLRTRLLLRATLASLTAMMRDFRPDVVHFICHGAYDANRQSFLQLVDPENAARAATVYPKPLVDALDTPLPSIVVLSACHTANQDLRPVGQVAAPFAAALVDAGVPVAVGMAGRIMDQACRLFTRRFYESLLSTSGNIAHAAADGRRAAIRDGQTDPERSVDWTMPTIFFSDGVKGTSVTIEERTADRLWHSVSREFAPGTFPAFCDRLEICERFDLLLSNEATQKVTLGGGDLQTLTVACLSADGPQKYGRTWLLKELATQAMRSGHVACFVERKEVAATGSWPRTPRTMLDWISIAVNNTVARFATYRRPLQGPFCPHIRAIVDAPPGAQLPAGIAASLNGADPDNALVQAAALRTDLVHFLETVRQFRPEAEREQTRLVLLIDDLHNTSPEVVNALEVWLGSQGLRQARYDVRSVLMFSAEGTNAQQGTIDALAPLGNNSWTQRVDLDKFRPPIEERDAYQFFLLNWFENGKTVPLVVVESETKGVKALFDQLSAKVAGVPSNLSPARDIVEFYLFLARQNAFTVLQEARDDALLRASLAFQREAAV